MPIQILKTVGALGTLSWTGTEHEGWIDVVVPAGTDVLVLIAQSKGSLSRAQIDGKTMRQLFQEDTSNISVIAAYEYLRPPTGLRRLRVLQPPAYTAVLTAVMLRGVDMRRWRIGPAQRGTSGSGTFTASARSERGAFVFGGVTIDTTTVPVPSAAQTTLYAGLGVEGTSVYSASYRVATGTTTDLVWTAPQTFNRSVAVAYRPSRLSRFSIIAPLARYSSASISITARKLFGYMPTTNPRLPIIR